MALITFMSDSGDVDHYVAAVKAKIFSLSPNAQVVDISHHIKPFDIAHAAFVLQAVYKDFPVGSVHIIGINTQDSRSVKHVAVKMGDHYFVGPDNGVIALLAEEAQKVVVQLPGDTKSTFPEKDLYANAATFLANEKSIYELGVELDGLSQVIPRQLKVTDDRLVGNVIHIDHYGNVITNITKSVFEATRAERNYEITFGREKEDRLSRSYFDKEEGDCIIFFNASGFMEIAINKGNAAQLLGLRMDRPIIISFR